MEKFVKGEIVVTPFPFSDLSASKKRPAMIIATLSEEDVILCQITSQPWQDANAIILSVKDFKQGRLEFDSYIKPTKLFTADKHLILYKIGKLKETKILEVENKLIEIIRR